MARTTGASLLAQALKQARVERIFTLSGNQVLPIYDALLDVGITVIDTRHESAAAHMADAWARLRGEPGVCLVTAAPGHTNALTGVANAFFAESPVLWLSGGSDVATAGKGGFQEMDQVGVARPVTKAAWQAKRAEEMPGLIARAWGTMLEGRPGPVHLTLPYDLLEQETTEGEPIDPAALQPAAQPADPDSVARALEVLSRAERPLIIASPSASRHQAGQQLTAFSEATGIPWFTVESPRGLTDPALNGIGEIFPEADAILLAAPQDFVIAFAGPAAFNPDCTLIQIAPKAELGQNRPVDVGLAGDAASVFAQLHKGASSYRWDASTWRVRLADVREQGRAKLAEFESADVVPIHPLRLAAEVRAALPADAIISQDGGEFGQWARWAFGGRGHTTLLNGKFGQIGTGIPFAMAAALARPGTPAVAFIGDGTFGFHGFEFDTAVRHGIPFIAIVGNDAAWAAERHRQVRIYGPDRIVASDLLPTRYDEVVQALGGAGEYIERPEQIRPAIHRALESGKPTCLNVMIRSVPSPAQLH